MVSADVPPERKPERGYVRQNHPFTKPPFYLPVSLLRTWTMMVLVGVSVDCCVGGLGTLTVVERGPPNKALTIGNERSAPSFLHKVSLRPPRVMNVRAFGSRTSVAIPPTPDRAPNPHFLEKRVSGSKGPRFPSTWRKEFSVKNSPFFYKGTQGKWGFFDRKLPFPGRGEVGVFGPRGPLFQEMGVRGPVWGRGHPRASAKRKKKLYFPARRGGVALRSSFLLSRVCLFFLSRRHYLTPKRAEGMPRPSEFRVTEDVGIICEGPCLMMTASEHSSKAWSRNPTLAAGISTMHTHVHRRACARARVRVRFCCLQTWVSVIYC